MDLKFMDDVQPLRRTRSKRTRRRLIEQLVRGLIRSGDGGYTPFYGEQPKVTRGGRGIEVVPNEVTDKLDPREIASNEAVADYWESLIAAVAYAVSEWWDDTYCEGCAAHEDLENEFLDLFVAAWNHDEETD